MTKCTVWTAEPEGGLGVPTLFGPFGVLSLVLLVWVLIGPGGSLTMLNTAWRLSHAGHCTCLILWQPLK